MDKKTVTIVGSYNVALFLKSKRLPSVGETVIADEYFESKGGKGSNQAVAAARFGAETRFIGRIGTGENGKKGIAMYEKLGIATDSIIIDDNAKSGIGISFIDGDGNNMISVAPGANYFLSKDDIDSSEQAFRDSFIVGFQLQNSIETVFYGIRKAHELGVRTFLDPSPVTDLPDDLYPCIDIIKPNEVEAATLTGIDICDRYAAEKAGEWFIERGVKTAIISLAEHGAVLVTSDRRDYFPSPKVSAVDTTGAGDVFIGGLLANLSIGKPYEYAIPFANHAAAISTRGFGVIDAIPDLQEVIDFMGKTGR